MNTGILRHGWPTKRLAALSVILAVASAVTLAPAAAFANDVVSPGMGDVAVGDQVYLGVYNGDPVVWIVEEGNGFGDLTMHTDAIMFDAPIDVTRVDSISNPHFRLEESDLYTRTERGDDWDYESLPMFRNEALSDIECEMMGDLFLSGNFEFMSHMNSGDYWTNEPLVIDDVYEWDGTIADGNGGTWTDVVFTKWGVRPAASFRLSYVLFSSDAESYKSDSAAGGFSWLGDAASFSDPYNAWKLTVRDSSRSITASARNTTATIGYDHWTIPVTFSGGGTGAGDYVSAILCNQDGKVIYYGTVAVATASGTQDMVMPTNLAEGTYTLKVFSEQRNGKYKTDYAGDFVDIELTVEGAAIAEPTTAPMYRLYNPYSGEHFYTADAKEQADVVAAGWNDEGTGWYAPAMGQGDEVYRLYNQYAGEHHYTMDKEERDMLVAAGWNDEGVGWYSDPAKAVPLFREYNPNQFACNHNYTADRKEHDYLVSLGWKDEGTAWYAVKAGKENNSA